MILWDTILKRLMVKGVDTRFIDVRYTEHLRMAHPECFPTFQYEIIFNWIKLRYEFTKIKP